jgi:hypothetical protein
MTAGICLLAGLALHASLGTGSTNLTSVRIEVADGSTLIGETMQSDVMVRTSFADIVLPLDRVASLRFTSTNGVVAVRLRNGDSISGKTDLRQFGIVTIMGKVTVPVALLQTVTVMLSGSGLPPDLFDSLVLYYSFDNDEDDRVTDGSPKENHGKLMGKPAFSPNGKVGGALTLDGMDDYIDAGNAPSLRLQRDFTLMAWVWFDSLAGAASIIGKSSNPEQDGRAIEMYVTHEQSVSGYFWQEGNQFFSGSGPENSIGLSRWHHVVMQHDSTLPEHQMRFYLDGTEHKVKFGYEITRSIPRIRQTQEPLRIGCFRQGSHHLSGRIDEVMIFSRVLTAEEVKRLYETNR